jgi:hypothetical protein
MLILLRICIKKLKQAARLHFNDIYAVLLWRKLSEHLPPVQQEHEQ